MFANEKIPIYMQLKNMLLSDIKNGKYPENSALPAVNIIADNAGCSVRTAYLAVQELIKDGVCFKRPKKGTYVGNPANLAKHPVCAVWTEFNAESPFEYPLSSIFYCGLLQGCADYNITPVLISDNPESVIKRYARSREFDFKGVIVLDEKKFEATVELAKKFPDKKFFFINYVTKNMDDIPPNMTAIVNDNYCGAYKMTEHIIAKGLKDIVLFSVKLRFSDRTYHDRMLGALAAAEEYKTDIKKNDIFQFESPEQSKKAYLETLKIIRSGRRPQAIFCTNDLLAEGVCQALATENIDNILVTGYDFLYPNISQKWGFPTMHVPYTKMVKEALRRLNSDEEIFEKIIKLQPTLKEK